MPGHELSDKEWSIIEPLLLRKSRGVKRVDDRRVINGIPWRFRTGSSWRDVPERLRPTHDAPQPVRSRACVGCLGPASGRGVKVLRYRRHLRAAAGRTSRHGSPAKAPSLSADGAVDSATSSNASSAASSRCATHSDRRVDNDLAAIKLVPASHLDQVVVSPLPSISSCSNI